MKSAFQIAWICFLLLSISVSAQAQKVPTRLRVAATPPPAAQSGWTAPSKLTATGASNREIDLIWSASTDSDATVKIGYQVYICEGDMGACTQDTSNKNAIITCSTAVTTDCFKILPPTTSSDAGAPTTYDTTYSAIGLKPSTAYTFAVIAQNANNAKDTSLPSIIFTLRTASSTSFLTCLIFPVRSRCMDYGTDSQANINTFYQTNGNLSFLSQVKSIYNGASGSATVSADLATLNFADGWQLIATTNAQAGSAGTVTSVAPGVTPTLSATGAAQATQNLLYGGNFLFAEQYPVLAVGGSKVGTPGNLGYSVDFVLKEGADVQNFKSGANVNVVSPPFHGSAQLTSYLQYNSINLTSSGGFQGAVFLGGSYGYTYISHGYSEDYGFQGRVHNDIGQAAVGLLINGVATISVSRAWGPPQTYIDSTTMVQTKVNNFKAVSLGITYQSPPPSK
jgi:hypothetical protein